MRNSKNLKGSKYNISVKEDMSREDREKERQLREEAGQKNEGNLDPQWVYAVRGEMWNRKVVKLKKRGEKNAD